MSECLLLVRHSTLASYFVFKTKDQNIRNWTTLTEVRWKLAKVLFWDQFSRHTVYLLHDVTGGHL